MGRHDYMDGPRPPEIYGWPFSLMDGPFHFWMALSKEHHRRSPTTCGWPPPNLCVAPTELMDGPSRANFYTFDAKNDQFHGTLQHLWMDLHYYVGVTL